MKKLQTICIDALSSRRFLWLILVFFVLESMWIALSFNYPLVYDEAFHYPLIQFFARHQTTPIIFSQPHSADIFGNLTFGSASLFHYIMSFPYRLITAFTNDNALVVIFIRTLNILMVAIGLFLFDRLFSKMGIKQGLINVGLLAFILIPLVPFCAATTSYDNMLFPLTAWYLIVCHNILQAKGINWRDLTTIVILGCLTCLVKVAFLPLFAASVVYLAVVLWRRHRKYSIKMFIRSAQRASKKVLALYTVLLVIFIGFFSVRFLLPVAKYGSPTPDCAKVMPASRCLDYSDKIVAGLTQTVNNRPVNPLPQYLTDWFSSNLNILGRVVAVGPGWGDYQPPLPVINSLLFFGMIFGVGALIYAWRSIEKSETWYFLLAMMLALLVVTLQFNYSLYTKLHYPFAIQPRYLLNLTPVLLVLIAVAFNFILRKSRGAKLMALAVLLMLFTQGGGATSYILRSKNFWFWDNPTAIRANDMAKKVLAPIVKEQ